MYYSTQLHPKGYQPLGVYKFPDEIYCMIRAIEWLYFDALASKPMVYQHLSRAERNAEIIQRYLAGESTADLARAFEISDRRVRYIVNPDSRKQ